MSIEFFQIYLENVVSSIVKLVTRYRYARISSDISNL